MQIGESIMWFSKNCLWTVFSWSTYYFFVDFLPPSLRRRFPTLWYPTETQSRREREARRESSTKSKASFSRSLSCVEVQIADLLIRNYERKEKICCRLNWRVPATEKDKKKSINGRDRSTIRLYCTDFEGKNDHKLSVFIFGLTVALASVIEIAVIVAFIIRNEENGLGGRRQHTTFSVDIQGQTGQPVFCSSS